MAHANGQPFDWNDPNTWLTTNDYNGTILMGPLLNTDNCTFEICDISTSNYAYRPSLGGNAAGLALFVLAIVLHSGLGIWYKTWGFMTAIFFGCVLEILGYAGRVMSYNNPWGLDGFLMQICCLTIAPAFFAAGVYLCLARIVISYGTSLSRFNPKFYTYTFITCDFVSLCLQGAGGGIASSAAQGSSDTATGGHIMLAGIVFQVFSLSLFMALAAEFAWRVKKAGSAGRDPAYESLRNSFQFKGFLSALCLATMTIFIRSVYRVVELSQGFNGALAGKENLFFVFEAAMIVIATYALIIFHPGISFGDHYRSISNEKSQMRAPWKKASAMPNLGKRPSSSDEESN